MADRQRLVRIAIVLAAVIVLVLATPLAYQGQQLLRLEGLTKAIAQVIFLGGDTIYGDGFSDSQFLRLTSGMTESKVAGILGAPLDRYRPVASDGPQSWDLGMRWSRSAADSSYAERAVLFRNGRVARRIADFYID